MFKIKSQGFNKNQIITQGNKYLIGNGYLGYRGTLDEYRAGEKVALNIPCLYDKVADKWCEPINLDNPLYTRLKVNDQEINVFNSSIINHKVELDLKHAIYHRDTTYQIADKQLRFQSSRFLSHANKHYLACEYCLSASNSLDVVIESGIDSAVWDLNGPHLINKQIDIDKDTIIYYCETQEQHVPISMVERIDVANVTNIQNGDLTLHRFTIHLEAGQSYRFTKTIYISYGKTSIQSLPYVQLLQEHKEAMKKKWQVSDVKLTGSRRAQLAIRYSIYHLLIIAPDAESRHSIPARGVSGQVYKGAIFWDTEIFMLPFFLLNDPQTAKSLLEYRIDGLKGALAKAQEFGYDGAFYAWESTDQGIDQCSLYNVTDAKTGEKLRTYFRDKQIHISADVVYGLYQYYIQTNDLKLFFMGGLKVCLEVAKFYLSRITNSKDILDVTGPDEYHERVNNNAYTNKMVSFTLQTTLKMWNICQTQNAQLTTSITQEYQAINLYQKIKDALVSLKVYHENTEKIIEQFDGYFNLYDISLTELLAKRQDKWEYLGSEKGLATPTQIIKQADVMTMLYLFKDEFSPEVIQKNFDYYYPRTEHGSSLSQSIYALTSIICGDTEKAYELFLQSALIDYYGHAKAFAGGIYIGGTHPAASGGAYMTMIYGFAGVEFKDDEIVINPNLPKAITKMQFQINYLNKRYAIKIVGKEATIHEITN